MKIKKMTSEQKLYNQSMLDWFKEAELSTDITQSEIDYYLEQIKLMKAKLPMLHKQLSQSDSRVFIMKTNHDEWLSQFNKSTHA